MTTQITANNIAAHTITVTQLVPGVLSPKIQTVSICDSSYNVLDDTAANTTGGYIQITGSTFGANSQVIIGTNNATSVTFVNTSTIRAEVPAASATSYPVYVIDTDTGATAIKINGLTHSSFPAWSTGSSLSNQASNTSFGVNLSASSDSNITYTNTSALPDGTTLAANGYFSGTVSIGSQTTYPFGIKATDSENQDATRTFSMTVTVIPPYKLYSWGLNHRGQLGLNNIVNTSSPIQVGTDTSWLINDIGYHSAAIKTDGTLWTWGNNTYGQLGLNDVIYKSSPTQIGTGTNWSKYSEPVFGYTSMATKTDGTLWGWGINANGQLGLNDIIDRSSPVQIGSNTDWNIIKSSFLWSAATKTNGTLWAWGQNTRGQLGQNNTIYKSSPVQIGALTNWNNIEVCAYNLIDTKTDGSLWIVGSNQFGQLANNSRVDASSPVQIGSQTNWSKPIAGWNCVFAIKTDGTLWAWGRNDYKPVLGLGDSISRSSPTQVGSGTTWLNAESGFYHIISTKTDGTLWGWGANNNGQLGLQNLTDYNSPKQIGSGTTWLNPSAGGYSSMATKSN